MNKDCQPSSAIRKRRVVKRTGNSKTAQLEEKLDGLVSLLKSATQQQPGLSILSADTSPISGDLPSRVTRADSSTTSHVETASIPSGGPPFGTSYHQGVIATPPATWTTSGSPEDYNAALTEPSLEEAEKYLHEFKNRFLKFFPFIFIPSSTSAEQLRQTRPLVWHNIVCLCSKSCSYQLAFAQEFRAIIGREAFVNGTRSLDFLQAVLMFSKWDRHHCMPKPIMANLNHLAISLSYDLGLHKPPVKQSVYVPPVEERWCPKPVIPGIRSLEERRVLLACYYSSSL
jgi:hypothetical protein